jgi:hypothetical protein
MSLAEAMTNVVAGYCIAVVTQVLAFPLLGHRVPLGDNLIVGAIFTVVSIIRSYTLRRCFETLRLRGAKRVDRARSGRRDAAARFRERRQKRDLY